MARIFSTTCCGLPTNNFGSAVGNEVEGGELLKEPYRVLGRKHRDAGGWLFPGQWLLFHHLTLQLNAAIVVEASSIESPPNERSP